MTDPHYYFKTHKACAKLYMDNTSTGPFTCMWVKTFHPAIPVIMLRTGGSVAISDTGAPGCHARVS